MTQQPTDAQTLLAIDTSGPRLQLALARHGQIDVLVEDVSKGHAEIIFDRIAALLSRNDIGYADLTRLAVTTGPGSFTGLRIGLSTAHGLGLALDIPVIGIPTLLAHSLSDAGDGPVAVLVDARRDEAYFEMFDRPGLSQTGPQVLPMTEARARLQSGVTCIEAVVPDIAKLAEFALDADESMFPARPTYVRAADAKPQQKARIKRVTEGAGT